MDDDSLTSAQRADIILNRTNVALARSQRLIQSWLPPRPPASSTANPVEIEENDDDFKGMSELGGLGSKNAFGEEGLPDGSLRRSKLSSNDKLLEQLLGKKAMQAKRKKDEAQKKDGTEMGSHAAPKGLPKQEVKKDVESEDEEEGRSAAFASKKGKGAHKKSAKPSLTADNNDGTNLRQSTVVKPSTSDKDDSDSEPQRPTKKRPSSYLDELLSQKANKKGKKRK
ncbi:Hypothetical protein R9X50_00258200 [Acrodontium crateriforme]|uniref:Uncharacterized protein n=1 Tax=Acrodontium crateriforme TaxID=150365 RepID=A0AAQ3M1A7_9PEZI|nr:Hypothetical protein R9X50_00258200 [Acrodontium crateriforme]